MFCVSCGKPLVPNTNFCANCGRKTDVIEESNQKSTPTNATTISHADIHEQQKPTKSILPYWVATIAFVAVFTVTLIVALSYTLHVSAYDLLERFHGIDRGTVAWMQVLDPDYAANLFEQLQPSVWTLSMDFRFLLIMEIPGIIAIIFIARRFVPRIVSNFGSGMKLQTVIAQMIVMTVCLIPFSMLLNMMLFYRIRDVGDTALLMNVIMYIVKGGILIFVVSRLVKKVLNCNTRSSKIALLVSIALITVVTAALPHIVLWFLGDFGVTPIIMLNTYLIPITVAHIIAGGLDVLIFTILAAYARHVGLGKRTKQS